MAHALRKQARGHDCEDLAIDLTALLLDIQRRQDADGARGARKQRHAPPRCARTEPEGLSVKSDPLAARGKHNGAAEERRKRTKTTKAGEATSGNGRLEQTRKAEEKKAAVLSKAKATWSSIIRLRRPHHQQKEADAPSC
jgi:hypothetical protein